MLSSSRKSWLGVAALAIVASLVGASRSARAEFEFEVVKGFALADRSPSALVVGSDGALYGTTNTGGSLGLGMVFRVDSAGSFTELHSFSRGDGAFPTTGALVVGADGALYGTTISGGSSDRGTVFRIDQAGTFTSLHSFNGVDGGLYSFVPLVVGNDGALYGVSSGVVFRIDTAGNFAPLHRVGGNLDSALVAGSDGALYGTRNSYSASFGSTGGVFRIDSAGNYTWLGGIQNPGFVTAPVVGRDGALYGTTDRGGAAGNGTIFRTDSAGNYTTLRSFGPTDGSPSAPLVMGSDGAFYGKTTGDASTIFRIDGAGNFSTLYSFGRGVGLYGWARTPLTVGSDGALYGTFLGDGPEWLQLIFRIDGPGNVTIVYSFSRGGEEGAVPVNALVPGVDGALYGTTIMGGSTGRGTIFRVDSAGNFASLHSFGRGDDGVSPQDLVLGSDGALYGTTEVGGSSGRGTVFRLDSAENFTSLHSFGLIDDLWLGKNALVVGIDGALYGTTKNGDVCGTVFRLDAAGSFTSLHAFTGTDGGFPSALVLGGDGALYGTTQEVICGGLSSPTPSTIFRIDSAGNFASLHSFDLGGGGLSGPLVSGSDGAIYGTTASSIFRIDETGSFTPLHSFDSTSGSPSTPLVVGSDGALYGLTASSIYRIDHTGAFARLHAFGEGIQPVWGSYSLTLGSGGALYGTTPVFQDACPAEYCTYTPASIFKIDGNGTFEVLRSYGSEDPLFYAGLSARPVLGWDGALYTTLSSYGAGYGAIIRVGSDGSSTVVHTFPRAGEGGPGADGGYPSGTLVLGSDCALYGTAPAGGPRGGGVVYRLFEPGHLCQSIEFDQLADRVVNDRPFTVTATASSGLSVSFRASGHCTVSGDQIRLMRGVGMCRVTAFQIGDSRFEPAAEVTQEFRVRPPVPRVASSK